jgi:hypothetical protein
VVLFEFISNRIKSVFCLSDFYSDVVVCVNIVIPAMGVIPDTTDY